MLQTTFAIVITLFAHAAACACGCVALPPQASDEVIAVDVIRGYERATAVFSAEVLSREYVAREQAPAGEPAGAEVMVVKLAVEERWKGEAVGEVVIHTSTIKFRSVEGNGVYGGGVASGGCDYSFEVGKRYLVYASGAERLRAHSCSRTKPVEEAERDVRVLDKLRRDEDSR